MTGRNPSSPPPPRAVLAPYYPVPEIMVAVYQSTLPSVLLPGHLRYSSRGVETGALHRGKRHKSFQRFLRDSYRLAQARSGHYLHPRDSSNSSSSLSKVVEQHILIICCCYQLVAIWTEADIPHLVCVVSQGLYAGASVEVPQLHLGVTRPRDKV